MRSEKAEEVRVWALAEWVGCRASVFGFVRLQTNASSDHKTSNDRQQLDLLSDSHSRLACLELASTVWLLVVRVRRASPSTQARHF